MGHVLESAIDPLALLQAVADDGCGGQVLFLGTVRKSDEDGPVVAIEYSAYAEMADEEFDRILEEAHARWPEARFAVRHRIGSVPLGEPSIGIAVAAPHRDQAYAASRFVVDEAKRRLPIWKKEAFEDGSTQWRENVSSEGTFSPQPRD